MRIAILGSRGIPAKYGGFETIAQELGTGLAQRGFSVYVSCESKGFMMKPYSSCEGVRLLYFPVASALRNVSEILLYDMLSVVWATFRADLIYMLGYSSVLTLILPKMLGRVVIVNVDGLESGRRKFNRLLRFFYRAFEIINTKVADCIVVDSETIGRRYVEKYGVKPVYIPYGISEIQPSTADKLGSFGIEPSQYYLVIARLIPDNNIDLIVQAFVKSNSTKKLVIVGPLDGTAYVKRLLLCHDKRIAFVGGVYEPHLQRTLRHNCFAYVHGHEMGGTNPSLVEALSCANVVLAIDVPFNREVAAESALYFKKDPDDLTKLMEMLEGGFDTSSMKRQAYAMYKKRYTKQIATDAFIEFVASLEKQECFRPGRRCE